MKAVAALLLALPGPTADAAPELPYEQIALEFLQRYELTRVPREQIDLDDLLGRRFARVQLGPIELHYPIASLDDHERAETFKDLARELVSAELQWLEFLEPLDTDLKPLQKDLKTLLGWVKSWRAAKLGKTGEDDGSTDLLDHLGAKDKVREASARLADAMSRGGGLGLEDAEPRPGRVVLLPTRRQFAEFVAFAGWLLPADRDLFWLDNLATWTECRVLDLRLLALEFADPLRPEGDYTSGLEMGERDRTGLEQHVVQRGFYAVISTYFGESLDPIFASGLAMNLVIDQYGADNTRSEGDLKGRSAPPFEVFVPGGNPSGGLLPGPDLDGRFRLNKGSERFVPVLSQAQKQGASDARSPRDKLVHFLLVADDDVERFNVEGPYLGLAAKAIQPPPKRFESDYLEFYRAYKTAFVHWLRTEAGGSSKKSEQAFARLIQELARRGRDAPAPAAGEPTLFEQILPEIYGAPLSNAELDKDCLEGQFLRWLKAEG